MPLKFLYKIIRFLVGGWIPATWMLMHLGVTSILPFYPVTGGMAGLGLGLLYMVARAVINEWFDKRMGLATGLAYWILLLILSP